MAFVGMSSLLYSRLNWSSTNGLKRGTSERGEGGGGEEGGGGGRGREVKGGRQRKLSISVNP